MSAQHKQPGRSGKRARRERALARMEERLLRLRKAFEKETVEASYYRPFYEKAVTKQEWQIERLKAELARPLRPIPPHQTRKLTR